MSLGARLDGFNNTLLHQRSYLRILQKTQALDNGQPVVLVHLADQDGAFHVRVRIVGAGHGGHIEDQRSGYRVGGEQELFHSLGIRVPQNPLELAVFVRFELLVEGGDGLAQPSVLGANQLLGRTLHDLALFHERQR